MLRHMRPAVVALVCVVSLLAAPAATAKRQRPAAPTPTQAELAVLDAINEARVAHGLAPVRLGPRLSQDARRYARSLRDRNLFVHSGVQGLAEALAWGTIELMGPRAIVRLWLESPPHRTLLLWPQARRAGIGLAFGSFRGLTDVRIAVARFGL